MTTFDLRQHWISLTPTQKTRFVRLSGTTRGYLDNHVLHRRKLPRPTLLKRLVSACCATGAQPSDGELLLWFYARPQPKVVSAKKPGGGK